MLCCTGINMAIVGHIEGVCCITQVSTWLQQVRQKEHTALHRYPFKPKSAHTKHMSIQTPLGSDIIALTTRLFQEMCFPVKKKNSLLLTQLQSDYFPFQWYLRTRTASRSSWCCAHIFLSFFLNLHMHTYTLQSSMAPKKLSSAKKEGSSK